MPDRPSWDEWGLMIAQAVGSRGDCRRRQIGAVVMDERYRVLGLGFNGVAPGATGCIDGGCPRAFTDAEPNSSYDSGPGACVAVHAEANCLVSAGADKLSSGCTIYVTHEPCPGCWNIIRRFQLRCVYPESELS